MNSTSIHLSSPLVNLGGHGVEEVPDDFHGGGVFLAIELDVFDGAAEYVVGGGAAEVLVKSGR